MTMSLPNTPHAAGSYSIPSYVSEDARDLMTKMMTVDPMKRITIPQIKSSLRPFSRPSSLTL